MNPQPKPQKRQPKPGARLKRSPMKRTTAMRRALPRRITRPGPGSDPAYLEKVRALPCCAPRVSLVGWEVLGHVGQTVAHHAGPKTNDRTAVALCWKHHEQWHNGNGVFKGWTKADRRLWADAAIEDTQRNKGAHDKSPA